jgi:hypothetical protein
MIRGLWVGIIGFALSAVVGLSTESARAGTIVQMSSGAAAIGIQYNGTTLSTAGPQDTTADFTGFLDSYPDIATPPASLTLSGVTRSGPAFVAGTTILQQFTGGTVSLYDSAHTLLLSANLSTSALNNSAGLANGGLFTTSFSQVTGGTLAPNLKLTSFVFQMHVSNISGGSGLSVGTGGMLQSFTAGADANINGEPVPEPATAALVVILSMLTCSSTRIRKPATRTSSAGRV